MGARAIMIQGTGSGVGKSLLTAGLCGVFARDGYHVAPFKSQNMALNSFVTREGGEMGRAQVVQAEAARVEPHTDMNPVLLKPSSDTSSQVIVQGEVYKEVSAANYFSVRNEIRGYLAAKIKESYERLAACYDIIVIEGAGSPAEINLRDTDLANMFTAKLAGAPVLLAGDIDKGGVFASFAGTIAIISKEDAAFIKGFIINKFRGDISLLESGLTQIENITGRPVLGVVPYKYFDIDDEDSFRERAARQNKNAVIHIAVLRLPHISNFTDAAPLERAGSVCIEWTADEEEIKNADLIIIPGTKNTLGDLEWMRQNNLDAVIKDAASSGKVIFGLCGGYQILGLNISDPFGVEGGGTAEGLGLLPVDTVFEKQKTRRQVRGEINKVDGVFSAIRGLEYSGYEIHNGRGIRKDGGGHPFDAVINRGNIYGTYIHGIFDMPDIAAHIISALYKNRGLVYDANLYKTPALKDHKEEQYNLLADLLRGSLDMKKIYEILEAGV